MSDDQLKVNRRKFLAAGGTALAATMVPNLAGAAEAEATTTIYEGQSLQVWSCGGLAEAFMPANAMYEQQSNAAISYTGAFAGALGKSLLGSAQTEVFAPRVLGLAKKLKAQGKMLAFQPLCFTKYVLITPKGNPAGIESIQDLKRDDIKTLCSPDSSPPGGKAAMGVLKKSGVLPEAKAKSIYMGSCVQHDVADVAAGKADAAVVELRITRLPRYKDAFDVIEIPEKFFPAPPLPFTIGVMKWAKDPDFAHDFVSFITSEAGQAHFATAGFIPALSEEGERLTAKYGVTDA
ncbi:substrate-binding domain-containing protein [Halodesulfovibrio sp. MK-HDV]|uniref:substrate-binding domain-containing protein n=1 Tax=Halodesulfovibrio sp. MK-HDV TaxID=2599925 RepID=UPI00136C4360|nr:substrate-binding domain-containing protein [Halodesulfovibrio sp. MK-HDV]KAF1075022.1 Molybdate-binding protein ModA [Halodesulfovibrio sp. MK-HDV]